MAECIQGIADHGAQMVVLGSGDPQLERAFGSVLLHLRPEQFGYRGGYSEQLAHRIEGGSDMFLMPSRYEPCGLNPDLQGLKYGTVPVVCAATGGGLDDTVTGDTGFKVLRLDLARDLYNCIRYAIEQFADREDLGTAHAARNGTGLLVGGVGWPLFGAIPAVEGVRLNVSARRHW